MDGVPGVDGGWYASACDARKPSGEHIEFTGTTPVRTLLGLARELRLRGQRRPRGGDRLPPAPPKVRERSGAYRSPPLDSVTVLGEVGG